MPFKDTDDFFGPLAMPEGMSVTPTDDAPGGLWDIVGAGFRTDNSIASTLTGFDYDPLKPFDPEYRPWDDIQGTEYEDFASRFAGARDREDVVAMKSQIDRELQDRQILEAAGGMGMLSQFAAAMMSPTTLLPGGAVVKGARGVNIARTGLSVAGSAAFAAALDEAVLQGTQQTRTAAESAFVIGGSFVLGGVLGAAAGKLSANQFKAASQRVEEALALTYDYDEALRSMGAAESRADLTLRREEIFQMVNRIPVLQGIVRSDPILRAQLSPLQEVRGALVDLVETPLQYAANDAGQSVRIGGPSVEARIRDRERNELASALSVLARSFSEYAKDGPSGTIGTLTAPVTTRFNNLLGKQQKLTSGEFMEEVGKAMRRGDKHPIPQVQSAADALRREIFDKIKDEAIEVGMFDEGLQIKNADSYFTRVYNTERIRRHFGDGTSDDIAVVLRDEFRARRAEAEKALQARLDDQKTETEEIAKATQRALDKEKSADEFYANASDAEIDQHVNDTVRSLLGLKPGQHSYEATLSSPTRARVLDVDDLVLEPWLESNAEAIMSQYFRQMMPDIELTRRFGDAEMTEARTRIAEEIAQQLRKAKSARQRIKLQEEGAERLRDLEGMRDRLRNRYGVPDNPRSGWIQANRALRTVSYMGYLGGMMLSAIPDVAGVLGRGGIEGAFGTAATALTNPKKLGLAAKDMAEIGAASEWWLNSRAMSLAEMFDPYGAGTKMERFLGQGARHFSIATGMIPWNVGWKSVGGAAVASKMSKAADAVRAGKATKKQLRTLAENGIEPHMAERIAKQLDQFGDKEDVLWLPRGQDWTDAEAFDAFRRAMNREFDLMVITPGQDKPLAFSTELGKFFLQFKSFAMSAHHRILLSGIQRADADVLAQVTMAMIFGGLTSNIKADLAGYDRKDGDALWEDAIDRSGLAGWLMEPYNAASALTGGRLSLTGEPVSRFQARNQFQGILGPSVDMGLGGLEAASAFGSGKASHRDVRKLMRPIPGNNIWYLLPLFRKIEEAATSATGATPRQN